MPTSGGSVKRITICPQDTSVMILSMTEPGSFMHSNDAGKTWKPILPISSFNFSESVFFHPTIPGVVLAAYMTWIDTLAYEIVHISKSTDYGSTWKEIPWYTDSSGYFMRFFCSMSMNPETGDLFLGGAHNRILRSTDVGESWVLQHKYSDNPFGDGWYLNTKTPTIRFSKEKPNVGFASCQRFKSSSSMYGLLKTTDYGLTWKPIAFKDTSLWALDVVDAGGNVEVVTMSYSTVAEEAVLAYSNNEGESFKFYKNPVWTPSFTTRISQCFFMPRTAKFKGKNLFYLDGASSTGKGMWSIDFDFPVSVEQTFELARGSVKIGSEVIDIGLRQGNGFLKLYNMLGAEVYSVTFADQQISIAGLPRGVYIVVLDGSNTHESHIVQIN